MNRRVLPPEVLDQKQWVSIDMEGLQGKQRAHAERCRLAMILYLQGEPFSEIEKQTRIDRRRFAKIFKRFCAVEADGRSSGERSFLLYRHVRPNCRTMPSMAAKVYSKYGHSGLLQAIFRRFPSIKDKVLEVARGCGRGMTASKPRYDQLHRLFLKLCREAGIQQNEYPFSVKWMGRSSFSRWIKKVVFSTELRQGIDAFYGEEAARRLGNFDEAVRIGSQLLPYDRAEFDGHRMDVVLTILLPDPNGGPPVPCVIERPWILVLVDAASRAILGTHLSLERHYTAEDVLICIENALKPWTPRKIQVPGLIYPEDGGLPSGVIPELQYAKWGELAFDNDKSNCAHVVWEKIRDIVGCQLNPGPIKTPDSRRIVERLFLTLEKNALAILPSTTGSSPKHPLRRDADVIAQRYQISLDEIMDLLDIVVAQYNALSGDPLFGRSPLEYLRFEVKRHGFFIRQIPEAERNQLCLTMGRARGVIRGNPSKGRKLYLYFYGVTYHSHKLNSAVDLKGQPVTIEYNSRDLRKIRIYLKNGEEFDELQVAQRWAGSAHDLRTRRAIQKCIAEGRLRRTDAQDVVQAYIDYKANEAQQSKKARNQLEHVRRLQKVKVAQRSTVQPQPQPEFLRRPAPKVGFKIATINF